MGAVLKIHPVFSLVGDNLAIGKESEFLTSAAKRPKDRRTEPTKLATDVNR